MITEKQPERRYDITAFGEILIDFTAQGENEAGQRLFAQNPGGAPANIAVAAGRLGARTAFLGKAGNDMHGRFLRQVLERERVETKGMVLSEAYFTTLAFVDISKSGERTFSFARKPGADTQIRKEELNLDILENTKIFHVGSLSLTDQPARDTTFYGIRRAKERGSIISYDPNYRASLWENEQTAKRHMRSLLPYVDMIKLSDEEIGLLTDARSVPEAAEELYRQGIGLVAITLGGEGAYVYGKDGGRKVSGFPSRVADTNGAGDSFWGGVLYQISRLEKPWDTLSLDELEEIVRFGNAVASLCVEKHGAIPAMPDLRQAEERLKMRIRV